MIYNLLGATVLSLLDDLRRRGLHVAVEEEYLRYLYGDSEPDIASFEASHVPDADMALSLGGDGTFLTTVMWVARQGMPILGINVGHLGYLTSGRLAEGSAIIDDVLAGNYRIEERTMLQVACDDVEIPHPWALNEVAVLRHDTSSMLDMETRLRSHELTTYRGDGLIVSTPTGSTAYSLSNGGPIIAPASGILCLTPVAPHSLNVRPIVISDHSEVTLTVESRSHHFLIAVDGRSEKCEEGIRLTIRKAPYVVRIVKPRSTRYFSTLREKLSWGVDSR